MRITIARSIANAEATQKDGFLKWLELDADHPMPLDLIENFRGLPGGGRK